MVYNSNSYNLKKKKNKKKQKTNLLFQQTEQFYDEMTRALFPPPQLFRILLRWSSFAPAKENGSVCYVQLHFALKSEASNQRKSNDPITKSVTQH